MSQTPLRDYIEVSRRFRRAVNIERDVDDKESLVGYVDTPAVQRMAQQIGDGIASDKGARAWSLFGAYGTGKSAFGVFVSRMVAPSGSTFAVSLKERRLFTELNGFPTKQRLWPVVVTAEDGPFRTPLLRALRSTILESRKGKRGSKPAVVRLIEAGIAGKKGAPKVKQCFQEARRFLEPEGLLLLIDEAGRALEFAAGSPDRSDVWLLQELAEETDAETAEAPFVLVTILHQQFTEYARRLDSGTRADWQKIEGRFADLVSTESGDQVVRLTAKAIQRKKDPPDIFLREWKKQCADVSKWVHEGLGWNEKELGETLQDCWPLHPVTAALGGPLFRGGLLQNERSLFAFLSSGEPQSFAEFVQTAEIREQYTVSQLYDYINTVLGPRLFRRASNDWAEIDVALQALPGDAQDLDAQVIKTIGLVRLFGSQNGLRPSLKLIANCVEKPENTVKEVLDRLNNKSVLYREYTDAYQLYRGSDLNLDALTDQALQEIGEVSVVNRLSQAVPQLPQVARRHLCETGTLRYFSVQFVAVTADEFPTLDPSADGGVFLVVPTTDDEVRQIKDQAQATLLSRLPEYGGRPIMLVLPSKRGRVTEFVHDLAACQHVRATESKLQHDAVALKALANRIDDLQAQLEREVARLFDPADSDWWVGGADERSLEVRSRSDVAKKLSSLCDEAYYASPKIRNELLNRRKVSPTAAKSRRVLLNAVMMKADQERLGIEGSGPELSMYLSLLKESGFHAKSKGKWQFCMPKQVCGALCDAFDDFLRETEHGKQSISNLYDRLRQPPFGIKDGPLPLIAMALFQARRAELAFYERKSFLEKWEDVANELFLKKPEDFAVRSFPITGKRKSVLEKLAKRVGADSDGLVDVVTAMLAVYAVLPDYTKTTARLSLETKKVRDALREAKEPAALVFEQLPKAVDERPVTEGVDPPTGWTKRFVEKTGEALDEIRTAEEKLVKRSRDHLVALLKLPTEDKRYREVLRKQVQQIKAQGLDRGNTLVEAFFGKVDDSDQMEDDAWEKALFTTIAAKPPKRWSQVDEDRFRLGCEEIAVVYNLVSFVVAQRGGQTGADSELVSVSVARSSGQAPQYVAFRMDKSSAGAVSELREQIQQVIGKNGKMKSEAEIALACELEARLAPKKRERRTP